MTLIPVSGPARVAGLLLSALLSACAAPAPTTAPLPTPVIATQAGPAATPAPAATTSAAPASPTPAATAAPTQLRLGLVTAAAADDLAGALRGLGWEVALTAGADASALRAAAQAGPAVIVADGPSLADLAAAAADFPAVYFVGRVDAPAAGVSLPANALAFTELDARQDQAGFLAGLIAGLATRTERVAVIAAGADAVGLKYRNGFASGVRYACPKCRLDSVDLADPAAAELGAGEGAKYAALGADVIFTGPGPAGEAALVAAARAGAWVIGSGRDVAAAVFADPAEPGAAQVLASVSVDWTAALRAALADYQAGRPRTGVEPLALANDGVQLTPLAAGAGPLAPIDLNELAEIRARLTDRSLETGVDPVTGAEQ